ncbi:MAG: DUF3472 domain-containing protein [Isosphaeraceae bacterium]
MTRPILLRHTAARLATLAGFCAAFVTAALADERLAGIACRSVHLQYPAPRGSAFTNAVTVDASARGTYFCVCGFDQGYYGIQELGNGRKVVIFSVWDPGKQDDPNSVDPSKRVKLVFKDPEVRVGRFGGEGTGGQSFLDLDWKPGETYRFLVTAAADEDPARTVYTAFIATPEKPEWRRLVAFSTLSKRHALGGYYAFIEDFRRNKVSATEARSARFGPGWVRLVEGGAWKPLVKARFTADRNPSLAIDASVDADGSLFSLATGGKTENAHTKLNGEMTLTKLPDREPTPPPVP